ncbi:MAG: DUF4332 domain-containing protein [Anaerolineaceae bacterium]
MTYYIDDDKVNLEELYQRIQSTDLVPSRASLLVDMKEKFEALKKLGIASLKDLRSALKNPKKMKTLSINSGLETGYLILLRREIEGYFPRPFSLKEFNWLSADKIEKLIMKGFRDSVELFEASKNEDKRLIDPLEDGIDANIQADLWQLCDLTRVQWVSPTTARMLVEIGIDSAEKLADADPDELCEHLDSINSGYRFFKGKIGLRDINRLIKAAGYVKEID